jgi:hypothetical protein
MGGEFMTAVAAQLQQRCIIRKSPPLAALYLQPLPRGDRPMRKQIIVGLILALAATSAVALNTKELLSTIAMPLAVAAVSELAGVPQDQLTSLVTTLNQANVPPTQFVEVIRYVPVALVDNKGQKFVAYVRDEAARGVTGGALVNAIVEQLQANYNVTPQFQLNTPATTLVVQNDYIPDVVVTRLGAAPSDPLTLVALPLAVAAVADITGVPRDQLADFVATLNNANVPPSQIIEVVRYVPVALIDQGPPFVQFVQQQATQITGPALTPVIIRRLQPLYPATQIVIPAPVVVRRPAPVVVVDQNFVPPVVVTRIEEVRQHPHGGPPGKLRKIFGLQTGAEVVHGDRGERQVGERQVRERQVVVQQPMTSSSRDKNRERQTVVAPARVPPPQQPVVIQQPDQRGKDRGRDEGGQRGQNDQQGKNKDNKDNKDKGKGRGKD